MSGFAGIIVAARDIARCLQDAGQLKFPVPVTEGLLPIIARVATKEGANPYRIDLYCKDWRGAEFRSCLLRYEDRSEILYSKDLNRCWRRFAVCKELAHVAFDGTAEWTTDYAALAQQLIADAPFAEGASSFKRSEDLCTLGAMELLMPWEIRSELEALRDAGRTDYEIALICKVPEQYVNFMLRSEYGRISADFHRDYDKKFGGDWEIKSSGLPEH